MKHLSWLTQSPDGLLHKDDPKAGPAKTPAADQITSAKHDTMTTKPEEPAGNRFHKLFTAVIFEPGSMQEYEARQAGKKSVTLAEVLLEIGNSGGFATGTIYGRVNAGKPTRAEFTWPGRANKQSIVCKDDPQAAAEMDEFKLDIARQYVKWSKTDAGKIVTQRKAAAGVEIDLSL